MLNYLYPSDIVRFSSTCKFIHGKLKNVWMQNMTCFHDVSEGCSSTCHVINQIDLHNEEDLFVLHYPFNQLYVFVRYGSCPWRYLHSYYQYIKHIVQDLRFDQVVGSMSHHPIHRNTIIPKTDTKDIKGFGVSNRIMRAGVFHVSFFCQRRCVLW